MNTYGPSMASLPPALLNAPISLGLDMFVFFKFQDKVDVDVVQFLVLGNDRLLGSTEVVKFCRVRIEWLIIAQHIYSVESLALGWSRCVYQHRRLSPPLRSFKISKYFAWDVHILYYTILSVCTSMHIELLLKWHSSTLPSVPHMCSAELLCRKVGP